MNPLPLSRVVAHHRPDTPLAVHHGRVFCHGDFARHVGGMLAAVNRQPDKKRWALFSDDAYPFAVGFFALLHAGRDIILPGNLTAATRERLGEYSDGLVSDSDNADIRLALEDCSPAQPLPPMDDRQSRVTIFTSGSTGAPKAIEKKLQQLDNELQSLESGWGSDLDNARIIATVSHQHIYGLLFRVLWPLASGRVFYSEQVLDNGLIHQHAISDNVPLAWVASPAHLKRLYEGLDWQAVAGRIVRVFSSGGPLPAESAAHVLQLLGQSPVEVLGSSETGGIASRCQGTDGNLWRPLAGVTVDTDNDRRLFVRSGHVNSDGSWYRTDDAAELQADGRFRLLGRLDRIVKLEEKRLSLVELEAAIIDSGYAREAYCWVMPPEQGRLRQTLTATVVANDSGRQVIDRDGRSALVKLLKSALQQGFELSLIPRKWRFVEQLPVNAQSKINIQAIEALMHNDATP